MARSDQDQSTGGYQYTVVFLEEEEAVPQMLVSPFPKLSAFARGAPASLWMKCPAPIVAPSSRTARSFLCHPRGAESPGVSLANRLRFARCAWPSARARYDPTYMPWTSRGTRKAFSTPPPHAPFSQRAKGDPCPAICRLVAALTGVQNLRFNTWPPHCDVMSAIWAFATPPLPPYPYPRPPPSIHARTSVQLSERVSGLRRLYAYTFCVGLPVVSRS